MNLKQSFKKLINESSETNDKMIEFFNKYK